MEEFFVGLIVALFLSTILVNKKILDTYKENKDIIFKEIKESIFRMRDRKKTLKLEDEEVKFTRVSTDDNQKEIEKLIGGSFTSSMIDELAEQKEAFKEKKA